MQVGGAGMRRGTATHPGDKLLGASPEERLAAAQRAMRSRNSLALAAIASSGVKAMATRSLSLNFGQLRIPFIAEVPFAKARRSLYDTIVASELRGLGDAGRAAMKRIFLIEAERAPLDFIQCQELWLRSAQRDARKTAEANGFICALADEQMRAYGLQLLIRKGPEVKGIKESGIIEYRENGKPLRSLGERLWGARRGFAYAVVELTNGDTILTGTTHLSPLPEYTELRGRQFVAWKDIIATLVREKQPTFTMVGADVNTTDADGHLGDFFEGTGLADAWAAGGAQTREPDGTMHPDFRQYVGGTWDMVGKRIDIAAACSNSPDRAIAVIDHQTCLDDLYAVGDERHAVSDHIAIATTYILGVKPSEPERSPSGIRRYRVRKGQ